VKLDQHKNAFLNLAIPALQLTEPGGVPQVKLREGLTVSIWDIWTIKEGKNLTIAQLFETLEKTY